MKTPPLRYRSQVGYNRTHSVNWNRVPLMIVAAVGLVLATASAQIAVRTFDEDTIGTPPAGFTFAIARQQTPGRWLVRADGSNHYLTHVAEPAASGGIALAVLDTLQPVQMRASVRLKLTDGERVGGLVWRYQDAENFYVAALDLRVQEVALYRVVRGNRIRLDEEDDLELDDSAWHTLRVVQDDNDIRVTLGGIGVMRARDRTFPDGGRAGVWSGGGATTWFDDLRIEPEENRRRNR
jgi:hypothetical protein